MPIKDKESRKEYNKQYRAKNKEALSKYDKERYNGERKERTLLSAKERYETNKDDYEFIESRKKYREEYKKRFTEEEFKTISRERTYKSRRINPDQSYISRWKSYGIVFDDQNKPIEFWLNKIKDKCECCGQLSGDKSNVLCLDHDHKTGKPRAILCRKCNLLESLIKHVDLKQITYLIELTKEII